MNSFICIFCPAIIAFLLFEKIFGKKLDYKYSLAIYLVFVFITNCLATVACQFVFHVATSVSFLDESPLYAIKYSAVSAAIGIVLAYVLGWCMKNVRVKIIVKKEKRNHEISKKRS